MRKLLNLLWEGEFSEFSEQYRWLGSLFVLVFIVGFSVQFTLLMHNLAYLGPGLGEESSTVFINALIFNQLFGGFQSLSFETSVRSI